MVPPHLRFGNGQFACLILCLTVSDLLTVSCGLLGGLILEVGEVLNLGYNWISNDESQESAMRDLWSHLQIS